MTPLFFFIVAVFSLNSMGNETPWSIDELKSRFQVRGESYKMDPTGKTIQQKGFTWNIWKPTDKSGRIENQWSSVTDDFTLAIRHTWQVRDDGSIKALIEQYKIVKHKADPKFEELVKREEKVLENLEPITFVAVSKPNYRIVVRFTPDFAAGESSKAITEMPISGSDVLITDNEGYVWATHFTHEGKYSGFSTHKGTIFMSYYPFPGSREFGIAAGNQIDVHLSDKRIVTFTSKTAYLPEGIRAKVFGIYHPDRKMARFSSPAIMDRGNEKEYVERIKTWPN